MNYVNYDKIATYLRRTPMQMINLIIKSCNMEHAY